MEKWFLTFCLIAFQAFVQCDGECVDLDPLSCVQMARQDPTVCQGSVATFVCPSFCGTCTPTCYDCQATLSNYSSCTQVKTCQAGEKCIMLYSDSSITMRCASQQMCDSVLGRAGDRRIQTASCCSSDRCNFPTTQTMSTTNTPATVPTTKSMPTTNVPATVPTTRGTIYKPVCFRDIEIMVQDSRNHTAAHVIKQYLKDMVNSMEIGPDANEIGVALFDNDVHQKFSFRQHLNKTATLNAIDRIHFHYDDNEIDKGDVIEFLEEKIREHHIGDRLHFSNVVIIIVDHKDEEIHTDIFGHLIGRSHGSDHGSGPVAKDVIVINIGVKDSDSPFMSLATDSNHVIHTQGISALPTTLPKLLELICID